MNIKKIHIHPFLYAVYPIFSLLSANLSQVYYIYTLRSAIISLIAALLFFLVCGLIIRKWEKSSLITTIILFFFFSYGHVLYFLRSLSNFGIEIGRHIILIVPYFALFIFLILLVIKSKRDLYSINRALDWITFVLLLLPFIQIVSYYYHLTFDTRDTINSTTTTVVNSPTQTLPDIYYIILDGYAREDKLLYEYGFDNHEFITQLRDMGFYVADCSRSNYNLTDFSLASSLNMDYLTAFGNDFKSTGNDREKLLPLINKNRVRDTLEKAGYQTVAFETGYFFTEWWDADIFLAPDDHFSLYQSLRPFEAMLLRSTIVLFFSDSQFRFFNNFNENINFPYNDHVKRVRYVIDKLPTLSSLSGPKFVFLHILVPHKPLVFDAEGNIQKDNGFYSRTGDPINGDYFERGYLDEIEFINSRLPDILKELINQSEIKPVIIINSDHGVWWGVRPSHANLAAFYLPDGGDSDLFPYVSNVNVFRVVFNRYFASNYPLLPDISYNLDDMSENGFSVQPEYLSGCIKEQ